MKNCVCILLKPPKPANHTFVSQKSTVNLRVRNAKGHSCATRRNPALWVQRTTTVCTIEVVLKSNLSLVHRRYIMAVDNVTLWGTRYAVFPKHSLSFSGKNMQTENSQAWKAEQALCRRKNFLGNASAWEFARCMHARTCGCAYAKSRFKF